MKPVKLLIRIWIGITTLLGFLGGWVLLAHAQKPAPLVQPQPQVLPQLAPLPTLAPLPPIGSSTSINVQPLQAQPAPSFPSFAPSFRTRGS
jgi:hypothetical protein